MEEKVKALEEEVQGLKKRSRLFTLTLPIGAIGQILVAGNLWQFKREVYAVFTQLIEHFDEVLRVAREFLAVRM